MAIDTTYPNITREGMNIIADSLETYLDLYESTFIIPKHLAGQEKTIKESIEIVRKLIKKLRKGKAEDVFKDYEE